MLLMVEERIRGGLYYSMNRYAKAVNKYMKDFDKNKKSSYLKYWDVKKKIKKLFLNIFFQNNE